MKPPAPGPVSGDSATNDISTAATAASTALPPSRRTSARACGGGGGRAATAPRMGPSLLAAGNELGNFDVPERPVRRPRGPPHARLGVGRHAGRVALAARLGAD